MVNLFALTAINKKILKWRQNKNSPHLKIDHMQGKFRYQGCDVDTSCRDGKNILGKFDYRDVVP
jgi:hypothetical protein